MSHSQALKKISLQDSLYNEETISKRVHSKEHIFELRLHDAHLGFVALFDLKTIVTENVEDLSQYEVKNIESDDWRLVYEHPHFQRRKLELISTHNFNHQDEDENGDDRDYYLLLKGQKSGPFKRDHLKSMLDTNDLLVTDLVSFNGGHTWNKLYQMEGLDRRNLKDSDHLPGKPKDTIYAQTEMSQKKNRPVLEALSGLAYLGHAKKTDQWDREQKTLASIKTTQTEGVPFLKLIFFIGLTLLISFLYLGLQKTQALKDLPFNRQGLGEQSDNSDTLNTPSNELENTFVPSQANRQNRINNSPRSIIREKKVLSPIQSQKTQTYTQSRNFEQQMDNQQNDQGSSSTDDNNYYYNDATPIELDPVQNQVSKETMEKDNNEVENAEAINEQ